MTDTNKIDDGRPAFAAMSLKNTEGEITHYASQGMSLRQYAAIKLSVPNSGTDWLDEMIVESNRNEFASQLMNAYMIAMLAQCKSEKDTQLVSAEMARIAYIGADRMLAASNSKDTPDAP